MKMSKKILPALAMLIVSAVMLSTASFAWFAIGSQVTVDGMTVGVKSDSAFLVIGTLEQTITAADYNVTGVTFDTDKAELVPVALKSNALTDKTGEELRTAAGTKSSWYYEVGSANDTHTGTGVVVEIPDNKDLDVYVVKYSVQVAVASLTNVTMKDLKATVTLDGDAGCEAVSVLVVGPDGYENLSNGEQGMSMSFTGTVALDEEIDNTPVQIDIYIYYYGGHKSITNNNLFANNIKDATVTVSFSAGATN